MTATFTRGFRKPPSRLPLSRTARCLVPTLKARPFSRMRPVIQQPSFLPKQNNTPRKPKASAPSAMELWAFSTTNQDVGLRRLYQRLPPAAARKILARAFPGGTAVPAIEMRRAEQGAREDENILDSIADELIAQYRHPMERACAA